SASAPAKPAPALLDRLRRAYAGGRLRRAYGSQRHLEAESERLVVVDREHREGDPDRVRLAGRRRHAQVDDAVLADARLLGERLQRVEPREVARRLVI